MPETKYTMKEKVSLWLWRPQTRLRWVPGFQRHGLLNCFGLPGLCKFSCDLLGPWASMKHSPGLQESLAIPLLATLAKSSEHDGENSKFYVEKTWLHALNNFENLHLHYRCGGEQHAYKITTTKASSVKRGTCVNPCWVFS